MVWAVFSPVTNSMYLPGGDFPGFYEELDSYYTTERRDAEIKAMGLEGDFKELQSMGIEHTLMKSVVTDKFYKNLGPLKDVECPKIYRLNKTPKKIGDMVLGTFPMVTESLKDIIETLEPGVHQFWPMTIELPRGKIWPEQYYGMRIATFLDSFRPDQSEEGSFTRTSFQNVSSDYAERVKGLAFSKDVFVGKHIWREVNLSKPALCISDKLKVELVEGGLFLPHPRLAKEV